ncbi:MAG: hypothetical protein J6D53_06080 [Blautia sp.]|nr:hypothetical protein [Blautia sp.]
MVLKAAIDRITGEENRYLSLQPEQDMMGRYGNGWKGVWNVTSTSLIGALSVEDEAQVVIPEGVTLTVDGTEYSGCVLTAEDF